MRLVAYLRISSTTQLEGFGLDVQRKAVRQWAKAHGHRIIAEYTDAGISGATDAVDRPGLSDALEQIGRPPRADGIIAARLDRVARALTVQEAILALCWRDGARVFTADTGEVLRDDPDDPMRVASLTATGLMAVLYLIALVISTAIPGIGYLNLFLMSLLPLLHRLITPHTCLGGWHRADWVARPLRRTDWSPTRWSG